MVYLKCRLHACASSLVLSRAQVCWPNCVYNVLSLVISLTDIPMGDAPLDMICVEEAGEVVHQIFLHPEEHMGKWLSLASSRMTITEYAATTSKVTGRKFVAGKASERCHL